MIKTRFFKTIIFLAVINLLVLTAWLVVLFLIQNDRLVIQTARSDNQPTNDQPNKSLGLKLDQVAILDSYFLTSSSTLKFLEQLENVGQQTGVKLQIGQATENSKQLQLQLGTVGTYSQTAKFLQSLENLPYATKLTRFDLGTDGKVWLGNFTLIILADKNI